VPTLTFQLCNCYLCHRELGAAGFCTCNVTRQATADWVVNNCAKLFPEGIPFVILTRDAKFDARSSRF